MIKVVIADDQELIRESLKIVLGTHEDIQVVSVASDGFEVLDILKRNPVDIILMDIRMPHMDGVMCTKAVKEQYPQTKIIILTTFDDDDFVFSALKFGASGYLLKGVSMVEDSGIKEISKPEWKVIQQVGFGLSNKEIAQKLFLSDGTVRNYLSSILSKLNLRDRTQLAIWAVQTGQTTKDFDYE